MGAAEVENLCDILLNVNPRTLTEIQVSRMVNACGFFNGSVAVMRREQRAK